MSKGGNSGILSGGGATSRIEGHQPELSLGKCHKYTIAKDCFTEIVLLTIISYFCVSTEQRFININQDKVEQPKQPTATQRGSIAEKTNRSQLLNNTGESTPAHSIKSAGIQSVKGLNSTLQRSTKDQTATSSTQKILAAGNSGGSNQQLKSNQ